MKRAASLIEAASEYRQAERKAHLQLEDACAQLVQWSEGFGVDDDAVPPHEDVRFVLDLTRGTIVPILRALHTLQVGHDGAVIVEASEATRMLGAAMENGR